MENIYSKIESKYDIVHKATKPFNNDLVQDERGRILSPKLQKLHHLKPGHSRMVRNPFGIVALRLYSVWKVLRDATLNFIQQIYHKDESKIYGTEVHGHVIGQLAFSTSEVERYYLHHIDVEIWGRTWLGRYRCLGRDTTDNQGQFKIPYDLYAIKGLFLRNKLRLEFLHSEGYQYENDKAAPVFQTLDTFTFHHSDLVGMTYNFGTIFLNYWEYKDDTDLPRVYIKNAEEAPQHYEKGRIDAISEQFIKVELITENLQAQLMEDPDSLSLADIQAAYPANMTVGVDLEDGDLDLTRTDEYFGMRMMNGTYANVFDKMPSDPDTYWLHYHWSSYDHVKNDFIFPNVTCKFKLSAEQYLIPTEIIISGALIKGESENTTRILTPADGALWQGAKRIARVQAGLTSQVERHFAGTHLNVEQYAIAVHRNIQRNPIGAILHPHLKGITLINYSADEILICEGGYITNTCPITIQGLEQRLKDSLGTYDWKNYRPVDVISDKHYYAKIANLYWDILNQFVTEFIDMHLDTIKEEWYEIYRMSNDAVKHSVPTFLCHYLRKHGKEKDFNKPIKMPDWFNTSGRMDLADEERFNRGDEDNGKAVSTITKFPSWHLINTDEEQEESLKKVRQFCVYVIYQATMGHFWTNFQQYDDIGELKYATLGLRFGEGQDGALGPEEDETICPPKEICIETMWWANMLSRTGYGFVMKNEDKDIHPRLIELLNDNKSKFAEYHFDIRDLQSRTNI